MEDRERLEMLVEAARAELDDPAWGAAGTEPPRFELFHAGMSMCSQKVRAVLAEKAIPYASHQLVIVASKGYGYGHDRPGVRLRVAGAPPGASYNDLADDTQVDLISGTAVRNGIPVELGGAPEHAMESV